MTRVIPDRDALRRTLELLAEPPEHPPVHDGFLDLMGSGADPGVGRIQGLWQNTLGSGAYDTVIRLGVRLEGLLPTGGGAKLRGFFDVPERLRLTGTETVLDVGSGPGNITRRTAAALSDTGLLVGLDVSTAMLHRAVRAGNPPNLVYTRADANRPPFADAVFDAVCSSLCLQLLPDPFAALDEFHRVLRPGGRLALAAPGRPAGGVAARAFDGAERLGQVRLFRPGELAEALRDRGFAAIEERSSTTVQILDARKPE